MARPRLQASAQEIAQQARADRGRALGMKLHAAEIAPLHAGAERRAVAAARDGRRARRQRVAVHEVGVVARRRGPRAGRRRARISSVFQPMCGTGRPGASAKRAARPGNDAEAARVAFVGGLEQQLHAEADAEHRLAAARGISSVEPAARAAAPWRRRPRPRRAGCTWLARARCAPASADTCGRARRAAQARTAARRCWRRRWRR